MQIDKLRENRDERKLKGITRECKERTYIHEHPDKHKICLRRKKDEHVSISCMSRFMNHRKANLKYCILLDQGAIIYTGKDETGENHFKSKNLVQ